MLAWQTRLVRLEDVTGDEDNTGLWEPFGVIYDADEETHLVLLKMLVEIEGERSSTKPENAVIWDPPKVTDEH